MSERETALLLIAHGSRDPSWSLPLRTLAERVSEQRRCTIAFLDHEGPDPQSAVDELYRAGVRDLEVVPLLLAPGGHVHRDLPAIAVGLQSRFPDLLLEVDHRALSERPDFLEALLPILLRRKACPDPSS